MNAPTKQQIIQVARALADSMGLMNVDPREVALQIDMRFPGMSDAEFDSIKDLCRVVVGEMKTAELIRVWS